MLPPISPKILTSNPNFESLCKTISTQLLESDASTKSRNISDQGSQEEILKYLSQDAKNTILASSLRDIIFSENVKNNNDLPHGLCEVIYIVSSYLLARPSLSPPQECLLHDEVDKLAANLSTITPLRSKHLDSQYSHLLSLAQLIPTSNQSPGTRLETHLSTALSHHQNLTQNALPLALINLINTLITCLTLHTTHLAQILTHLSRYTHGTLSRHTISKSTHLRTIADALSAKTQILALEAQRSTYAPATQAALANYAAHLDTGTVRLDSRIRVLEDEIRLYEACDGREGRTMEELARKYGEILSEIEVVKADVGRLERGK